VIPPRIGDLVTALDFRANDRAVHAVANSFITVKWPRGRPRKLNPRFDKNGVEIYDVLWAWVGDKRVRALFPAKEGLNWCRGHVDGSHLEAAWKLAKSVER
jgi:hypothetical protein